MFYSNRSSPYDLRFSLLGIPVTVQPIFWLITGVVAYSELRNGVEYFICVMLCILVSLLVHELGHALTANFFGWPPEIVLHGMGGHAAFQPGYNYTEWKSILITIAGPLAGFILCGIAYLTLQHIRQESLEVHRLVIYNLEVLVFVNLVWGLFNLIPVIPMDGGRILQSLCCQFQGRKGNELAYKFSIVLAATLGVYTLMNPVILGIRFGIIAPLLMLMFAVQNYQMLQAHQRGY